MRILLRVGTVGLLLTLALNLLALVTLRRPKDEFLAVKWWAAWFPCFCAWLVFAVIGLAASRRAPGKLR